MAALYRIAAGLLIISILTGCGSKTPPPEVAQAEKLDADLWRAGAETFIPHEYKRFQDSLHNAKLRLIEENSKFSLFRDYDKLKAEYAAIIVNSAPLFAMVEQRKKGRGADIDAEIANLKNRLQRLRNISSLVNEGSMSMKGIVRAELLVSEAQSHKAKGRIEHAEKALKEAARFESSALEPIMPVLNRFVDTSNINRWRRWAADTVEASKSNGGYAIIVSKLDRRLLLYSAGRRIRTYKIGIGINGANDKMHAGDRATPEGKYHITKKIPKSKYYKALLINYPNDEDIKQFADAKLKGLIARRVSIGGLIEIHGGGRKGMTYGCVAMDNREMLDLFETVPVGTPVTIVGATEFDNAVANAMKGLK